MIKQLALDIPSLRLWMFREICLKQYETCSYNTSLQTSGSCNQASLRTANATHPKETEETEARWDFFLRGTSISSRVPSAMPESRIIKAMVRMPDGAFSHRHCRTSHDIAVQLCGNPSWKSAHRAHLSYEFLNVPHIIMRPVLLPKMFGPARRYSVEFPLPSVAGRYSSTGFAPQIGQGQRKPTNVKENNWFISPSASLVSPSACMTLSFISSLCYMSVDEWRRRKSRGFPIQQEHQGLNRDEQVKDALSWCRDNTNCWGNLRLTM
jgi:hypothetical protein